MNKTLTKILIAFSCLAIQGCIIETDHPHPDFLCYGDWDCPTNSYCAFDGYCYETHDHIECRTDRDCPIHAWCDIDGLCYEYYYYY